MATTTLMGGGSWQGEKFSVFFLGLGKTLALEPVPVALIPVNPPLLDSAVTVDY